MSTWSANINVMIKAARRAGSSLMRDFGEVENLQVSTKGPGDFVSKADLRAEDILKTELLEARENYGWLAEEGGSIDGADPTRRWIVDPLDGTTNFLHGIPMWCVSIGLEHKGQIVAGVIYSPALEELYIAEKGGGAWLNDKRIRVSGRREMTQMVFGTGLPIGNRDNFPKLLKEMAQVFPAAADIRRLGSAAMDLAYVAAGRLDGYWHRSLSPWDMAAGIILVKEAGGLVESIEKGDPMSTGDIVAAPSESFDKFAKMVRNA
ncbi:MAG: inositol monophosphatase family protein [Pseudomonadota bacterium]